MIQVLMPMAGAGSRFKDFHQFPKPLIPVFEQPMFYWNCKLLQKYIKEVSFTFVVLKSHVESYQIDQKIKEIIPSANICIIPKLTEGALETAHACREQLDLESPLLITDCDLCFLAPEFFDFLNRGLFEAAAGALVSFESDLPRYSYAKLENNQVVKTAEKEVISNNALIGSYFFSKTRSFLEAAGDILSRKEKTRNEYYIAPLYNDLIKKGQVIRLFSNSTFYSFGAPDELNSSKEKIKEMLVTEGLI